MRSQNVDVDADHLNDLNVSARAAQHECRARGARIPWQTRCNAVREWYMYQMWKTSDEPDPASPHNLGRDGDHPLEVVCGRFGLKKTKLYECYAAFTHAGANAEGYDDERPCLAAGYLALKPNVPAARKLRMDDTILAALKTWAGQNPFTSISQYQTLLAQEFGEYFAESMICDALNHKLKTTLKVVRREQAERFTPATRQHAQLYNDVVSKVDPQSLHYFDESGLCARNCGPKKGCVSRLSLSLSHTTLAHTHAYRPTLPNRRSPRGMVCTVRRKNPPRTHWTLNALLNSRDGAPHIIYNIIAGATKHVEFLAFLTSPEVLASLKPGDTVVLDNCSTHHVAWVREVLEETYSALGVGLVYLPAYCPFFNAAEFVFSFVKSFLAQKCSFSDNATDVVHCARLAIQTITMDHIRKWYAHVLSIE